MKKRGNGITDPQLHGLNKQDLWRIIQQVINHKTSGLISKIRKSNSWINSLNPIYNPEMTFKPPTHIHAPCKAFSSPLVSSQEAKNPRPQQHRTTTLPHLPLQRPKLLGMPLVCLLSSTQSVNSSRRKSSPVQCNRSGRQTSREHNIESAHIFLYSRSPPTFLYAPVGWQDVPVAPDDMQLHIVHFLGPRKIFRWGIQDLLLRRVQYIRDVGK